MILGRLWRPGLVLGVSILAMLVARPAGADWYFTPFLGATFKGSTTILDLADAAGDVHRDYGVAVTRIGSGPIGLEGYFVYTPGFFDRGDFQYVIESRSYAVMGNLVLATPRQWNEYGLRPFISGGLGVLHAAQTDVANVFPISETLLALNVGGGAIGFFTDSTGVRFDLRFFNSLRGGEPTGTAFGSARLRYWTGSVGLVLRY